MAKKNVPIQKKIESFRFARILRCCPLWKARAAILFESRGKHTSHVLYLKFMDEIEHGDPHKLSFEPLIQF